jgi:hypothetical protein
MHDQPATKTSSHRPRTPLRSAVVAALALLCLGGCMQRRMTLVSNPPGATAYVDGVEIGQTPVSHDFIYYGTREIRLVKDGYETLTVMQPMSAPWYQVPPLDFFSDNLAFGEIRDERVYRYDIQPIVQVPFEQLVEQGETLRQGQVPIAAGIALPAVPVPGSITPIAPYTAPQTPGAVIVAPPTGFPPPGAPRRAWPTPD